MVPALAHHQIAVIKLIRAMAPEDVITQHVVGLFNSDGIVQLANPLDCRSGRFGLLAFTFAEYPQTGDTGCNAIGHFSHSQPHISGLGNLGFLFFRAILLQPL